LPLFCFAEKIPAQYIEITGQGNYDVHEFYGCDAAVKRLYPGGRSEIDYWKGGPKLHQQNVEVCKKIIENLDMMDDQNHGPG
jgi:hypothetical protein